MGQAGDFAQAVADVAGGDITAGEVAGSLVSDHLRRIVVLYLNSGDPDRLTAIGNAAIKVLQARNNVVFPQNGEGAVVTALDGVTAAPAPASLRTRLDIPLRLALGVALGVALPFLAWYFDPRVEHRSRLLTARATGIRAVARHKTVWYGPLARSSRAALPLAWRRAGLA